MNQDMLGYAFIKSDPWARIGQLSTDEYRSSIDIDLSKTQIGIEQIVPDAARNLAYRAAKLIEQFGWQNQDVSFVLTLTFSHGAKIHSAMSINQGPSSPHYRSDL